MSFSIEEFKSRGLVHGGARPSLFSVYVPDFPSLSISGTPLPSSTEVTSKIRFLAKAASLPASNMEYVDVPYMSRKIRVNGDRMFSDWSITVMNDEDFTIRRAMEGWHQVINAREPNVQDGIGLSGPYHYKRDIVVSQYGKTGQGAGGGLEALGGTNDPVPIYQYTLVGAFPVAVDAIPLDWDDVNRIEQFDVTFTYDYWEPADITELAGGVGGLGVNSGNSLGL